MPTQKNIRDIASDIARTRLPAMVIDTCVSFDIIRCVCHDDVRVIGITQQLIDAHRNGELLLYAHSVLQKEADRNRHDTEDNARKSAGNVDLAMDRYRQAAQYLGMPYPYALSRFHESVIPSLMGLHDRFLAACVHIVQDDNMLLTASRRASDNRRPARKGEVNDCLIFEEFRSIAQAVPDADRLILFTTNTDDFGDKSSGPTVVHKELRDDLVGTMAKVCLNWGWAASEVLSNVRMKAIGVPPLSQ